jgi:hypothetical protein
MACDGVTFTFFYYNSKGARRGAVVEALCCKSEGVTGIFHWRNPFGRTMALGSTHPLTEMITTNISWGKRQPVCRADNLATILCRLSWNMRTHIHVWGAMIQNVVYMAICHPGFVYFCINTLWIMSILHTHCGPGSSVGIATDYGLDGLGIESRWRRDFSHTFRTVLGPTQPPVQWVLGLFRG